MSQNHIKQFALLVLIVSLSLVTYKELIVYSNRLKLVVLKA